MSAYVVACINVTNPEAYAEYAKLAGPATAKYGGKFLVRGGKAEVMEGKWAGPRIVVTEFPDFDKAKAFYNSVEYQTAREKRLGGADFNMLVVEGV